MRYLASRTNRTWLFVLGLILLLAGALGALVATGALHAAGAIIGLNLSRPTRTQPIIGSATASVFAGTLARLGVGVGGLLLTAAGLVWLARQFPRRRLAKPFRLQDDPHGGVTRINASVLTDAVERQVRSFSGVHQATVQLRGTARDPELTMRVTADERADLRQLIDHIQHRAVSDLQTALDTVVTRLAVQFEVGRGHANTDHITL